MNCPRLPRAALRGVTFIEAGLVGSVVAALVTGLVLWLGPKSRTAEQDQAQRDAAVILEAAETWQERTDSTGCPSMSTLVEEHALPRGARLDDPWGERFRIACDGSRLVVWSPGVDKRRGTADDVRLVALSE
jgi:general secretion pathway protein G